MKFYNVKKKCQSQRERQWATKLASFPGLPCFYLPFVSTIIHRSGRPAKNGERPGSTHHMSGHEVDVGREGLILKYVYTKL